MAKFIHTNATAEALVLDAAWRQAKGPMKMYVFKKSLIYPPITLNN